MSLKQCIDCPSGVLKDTSEFHVSRKGKTRDGLKPTCKECSKARRRAWAAKNQDREREWKAVKYKADPDSYKEQAKQWCQEHPDRIKIVRRINEAARRARKLSQFVEDVDPIAVWKRDKGICGICHLPIAWDEGFHVDHVIPLAKGGEHSYANVQVAHPTCNLSKGANIIDEEGSMSPMTKYADAEGAKVLTPSEHKQIEAGLHKAGKTSARDLTDEQRAKILPQKG